MWWMKMEKPFTQTEESKFVKWILKFWEEYNVTSEDGEEEKKGKNCSIQIPTFVFPGQHVCALKSMCLWFMNSFL